MSEHDDTFMSHVASTEPCPAGPHRAPAGPNEDMGQCHRCLSITAVMRPEDYYDAD